MILLDHANSLPFPRSSTLFDDIGIGAAGDAAATAAIAALGNGSPATYFDQLVGRCFVTMDKNGRPIALRVCRADADITPGSSKSVAGACVYFTAGKIGQNVAGMTGTAGQVAAVIDDAYPSNKTTIVQNDLFYVVAEGYVNAVAATVTAGHSVVAAGSGFAVNNASATTYSQFVIGYANENAGGTTAGIANIHVFPDLKQPVPAS